MESYTLQSSTDGTTWTDYEENGQVKVVEVKGCIYINGLAHQFKLKEKCFCREFFEIEKKKSIEDASARKKGFHCLPCHP